MGETIPAAGLLYRMIYFTASSGVMSYELLGIPREMFDSDGIYLPRTTYQVVSYGNDIYVTGDLKSGYVLFSNSVLHFVDLPKDCIDALCYYRSYYMLPVFDGDIGVTAVKIVGKFGWSNEAEATEDAVYRYYITKDRGMNWIPYNLDTGDAD